MFKKKEKKEKKEKENSGKILEERGVIPVKEVIASKATEERSQQTTKLHNTLSGYSSILKKKKVGSITEM